MSKWFSFFMVSQFLFQVCASQQAGRIITLKQEASLAKDSLIKLKTLEALCEEWESYSPDTLKKYASLDLSLAQYLKDKRSILQANYYEAVYLFQVNKLDSALAKTENLIAQFKKDFPYDDQYVKLYGLKSNILLRTSRMDELMASNFELIKLTEQHKDTLGMARAILGIGNVNLKLKKFNEALTWYHKALSLMENPVYKRKLSFIYNNISITFYHLSNEDSAIYYVKQGILYARAGENLTNLANALFLHAGLLAEFNHMKEAEEEFKEGIGVRKKIGDVFYLIADMAQLALFYANNKNPQKGIEICKEGLDLAQKSGSDFSSLNSLTDMLARNYLAAGDYKNYSDALVSQMALKDSIYKKNSAESMAEMQAKYDVQRGENVIMQQQFDLTRKNYFIIGSLLLVLIILIASFFIFREYKRRQKIKTKMMLREEKNKAEKAVSDAEEAERKRIAADLHDSLGAYAASIVSNIDHINLEYFGSDRPAALQELKNNSLAMVSQLSDTIWALKKDALSLTSLSDRIKVFGQRLQSSYPDCTIDVLEQIETDHLLAPSQAFHLFQIVREALNNALRHSYGKYFTVAVIGNKSWKIIIGDDGLGMSDQHVITEGGNGLSNMITRSKESGWNIKWQAKEPRGTEVVIAPTIN